MFYYCVFLGHDFLSDVLLLRFPIQKPLVSDLSQALQHYPLEDALYSLAEALSLVACRVLDIGQQELKAGYRFSRQSGQLIAGIFIYDSLSGGAGYADMAGQQFGEIFKETKEMLSGCHCDSACHNCLQHYGNRYYHSRLNRHLGQDLIAYIEQGQLPALFSIEQQRQQLAPLKAMLELEGWQCTTDSVTALKIEKLECKHVLGTYPSLLIKELSQHPLLNRDEACLFKPYELENDLPSVFQQIN